MSFSKTTSNITSQSERTIERSVKRGNEITEEEAEVLKIIDAPVLSTIDKLKQGLSTIDKPLPKHNTRLRIRKCF